MPFAPRLVQNTVFLLCTFLNARVVLCNTPQHIGTFSNIHDGFIDFNAVNPGVFILCRKPLAFQPVVNILCVVQNTNSCFGGFWRSCSRFGVVTSGTLIVISLTSGTFIAGSAEVFVSLSVICLLFISISSGNTVCSVCSIVYPSDVLFSKSNPSCGSPNSVQLTGRGTS